MFPFRIVSKEQHSQIKYTTSIYIPIKDLNFNVHTISRMKYQVDPADYEICRIFTLNKSFVVQCLFMKGHHYVFDSCNANNPVRFRRKCVVRLYGA